MAAERNKSRKARHKKAASKYLKRKLTDVREKAVRRLSRKHAQ